MSLNGLDVTAVIEAHQSALADPGGWFLLKYANRDTVDILSQGTGGVVEAKGAVEQYEQKSPLYGLVQYRRKRVLLKYVPEGTSRLLQVRLSVQFQSILDAFPHDTIFSFTAPTELVESALGLCTMLQPTNTGSLKSSNSSVRQHRLNEISEDAEDLDTPTRTEDAAVIYHQPTVSSRLSDHSEVSTLPASALRAKALLAKRKEQNQTAPQVNIPLQPHFPVQIGSSAKDDLPATAESQKPRPISGVNLLKFQDETSTPSSAIEADVQSVSPLSKRFHHSRHLSENESESISQWNEQVAAYSVPTAAPKQKKKLAPRPHVETQNRPKSAHHYEDNIPARPVANLPQTVRVSNRIQASFASRPCSQQSSRSVPVRFLPTPHLPPPLPDFNPLQSLYLRPESRRAGSVTSSNVPDVSAASPEKMRLMKALQKRKRSQLLNQRAASVQSSFIADSYDFSMDEHRSAQAPSETNVSSSIPMHEATARYSRHVKQVQDSSTASPTSVATLSEDPSTRPSSYAEDQNSESSQKSASNDTDSSSTPKAVAENARTHYEKYTNTSESTLSSNDKRQRDTLVQSMIRPVDEPSMHKRDTMIPIVTATRSEQTDQSLQDRTGPTQLVGDSTVGAARFPNKAPAVIAGDGDHLHVDTAVQPHTENSSVFSDDDEASAFAEELQSATVHEAMPMSVSRPPLTPAMRTLSIERSRAATTSTTSVTPKSTRSTLTPREKSPGNSLHSLSTALPQIPTGPEDDSTALPLARKTTLGLGISQRIKALEDSSRRDHSLPSTPLPNDASVGRSTFSNIMKRTSFISQFQVPNASSSKVQATKAPKHTPPAISTEPPILGPTRSQSDAGIDSVASHPSPVIERMLSSRSGSERQNSTGMRSTHLLDRPPMPLEPPSSPSSEKKRFSFASYRSGSTAKWMYSESMASRLSLTNKESKHPRTSPSETSSVHEEKRGSRASRLMKRISGFGGRSGGKGQTNAYSRDEVRPDPILEQNENALRLGASTGPVMKIIDIGDVNVQFPEALLWKRRFLRIDDQGYLIFSAPTENPTARSTSRKFHLGDIQEPCLPDLEREEMAWSVLLDLRDGNCIQCACESKQAQAQVLKMLLDAHSAYHSLYPDALE